MPKASEYLTEKPKDDGGPKGIGDPALTKIMRAQFSKYSAEKQMDGEASGSWEEYVASQGAGLTEGGLVYRKK